MNILTLLVEKSQKLKLASLLILSFSNKKFSKTASLMLAAFYFSNDDLDCYSWKDYGRERIAIVSAGIFLANSLR